MDDPQCTKGGHQLCLLVICILAFITPAHTHGAAAAGATTLSIEEIRDLRTTVDELKAFSKAEKKVIDGIHHSLAVNADKVSGLEKTLQALKHKATSTSVEGITKLRTTVDELKAFSKVEKEVNYGIHHSLADIKDTISQLHETMQVLKDKATTSVEGIQDLRTTVEKLEAFSEAEKEVNDGIHRSVTVNAETLSRQEETLQVLKDKVNQLEQKQTAVESRIALKAENAHFVAIFNETQVNPGPIKFMPSSITAFESKDGDQTELSANRGSSKSKQDTSTGRFYFIPPEEDLTWWEANKRCQMEGGQLVSIGSIEEQFFIKGMIKDVRDAYYWIGGRRIQGQLPNSDATGWEWSDGSPFNFTNWGHGEPDNNGGHQDCIIISKHRVTWLDVECSLPQWRAFCEKPGIIFTEGVFTAPISGVYELGFTAWTLATVNGSMVDIHNNNRIIASASSNSVGKFGTNVIEELKAGDKVAVFLSQGAIIGGQSERSAKFFGKLIDRS